MRILERKLLKKREVKLCENIKKFATSVRSVQKKNIA